MFGAGHKALLVAHPRTRCRSSARLSRLCSRRWLDDVWVRSSMPTESDGETNWLSRGLGHPEIKVGFIMRVKFITGFKATSGFKCFKHPPFGCHAGNLPFMREFSGRGGGAEMGADVGGTQTWRSLSQKKNPSIKQLPRTWRCLLSKGEHIGQKSFWLKLTATTTCNARENSPNCTNK